MKLSTRNLIRIRDPVCCLAFEREKCEKKKFLFTKTCFSKLLEIYFVTGILSTSRVFAVLKNSIKSRKLFQLESLI